MVERVAAAVIVCNAEVSEDEARRILASNDAADAGMAFAARTLARAAIAAMREPTEAMKLAGALAILPDSEVLPVTSKEAGDAFAAMIDSALAAAEGGGDG